MSNRPETWIRQKTLKEGTKHPLYNLNRLLALLYKLEVIPKNTSIFLDINVQDRFKQLYYKVHQYK